MEKEGGLTEMYDVWKNVLADIERQVSEAVFSTFFKKSKFINVEDGAAIIEVPSAFIQKQIQAKYSEMILRAIVKNNIPANRIKCIVTSGKATLRKATPQEIFRSAQRPVMREQISTAAGSSNLKAEYTMDTFIVGSNNDLAAGVARMVIDKPGVAYNPFFLYGRSGLGKTHLIQAIGNELIKRNPNFKVLYVPINHFYDEFVKAIQANKMTEFSKKYQKLDVLIIDDIQFIAKKEKSQEEFFHLFNDFFQQNKQIIIASDRLPEQIETLDERLASRLRSKGAFDIQMPSFEDKCAILRAKADFDGKEIEQEVIEYIADNVKTNIRELEGEYNTIMAFAELKNVSPLELIRNGYVSTARATSGANIVSPKKVVEKTAKFYQMSVSELKSKSRVAPIKNARQVAMYILSRELGMSTTKIASEVGVSDHTTVMNGLKRVERDLKLDFALREQIEEIKRGIYA